MAAKFAELDDQDFWLSQQTIVVYWYFIWQFNGKALHHWSKYISDVEKKVIAVLFQIQTLPISWFSSEITAWSQISV
jgi:hypothetical protein